jgi:hypothetical protein
MTPGRPAGPDGPAVFAKPAGRRYIASIVYFPAEPTEQL